LSLLQYCHALQFLSLEQPLWVHPANNKAITNIPENNNSVLVFISIPSQLILGLFVICKQSNLN
jgi:hypothetical protein